jgi:predicted PurR-regulated permease PerM
MIRAATGRFVLYLLAALAVAMLTLMVAPFAAPLLVAAVLAGALYPWNERLAAALHGRRRLAAGLMTLAVLLAVVLPLLYLAVLALQQVGAGIDWVRQALQSQGAAGLAEQLPAPLDGLVGRALAELPSDLEKLEIFAAEQSGQAAVLLGGFLSATGVAVLKTFLALVAFFFLLVDGPQLVRWLDDAVPLQRGQVAELLSDFRRATVAVLFSSLATAGVQSAAAFLGYLATRVPHATFFAFVTFLVALVPALGAAPVVVGVGILQLSTGSRLAGVVLLAWAVPVSLIDNLLRPMLLRRGLAVHPVVIFFTLLGGLAAFGPLGFLLGPLSLAFLLAVLRMFRRDQGL